MADIYGYAHQLRKDEMSVLTLRDTSGIIDCGCRFKYIPNEISMSYQNLVNAIETAIDKEAEETNGKFITTERATGPVATTYDYDALMKEFGDVVGTLVEKDSAYYVPRITQVVEKYLGEGKKVADTTIEQAEFIHLILTEIKEEYCN